MLAKNFTQPLKRNSYDVVQEYDNKLTIMKVWNANMGVLSRC